MSCRRAFTLLELLLAMALNLVLLAAIATATFVFLRGFQRADREVSEAQLARVVFGRLGQDLRELRETLPAEADEADAAPLQPTDQLPPAVLRGSRSELQLLTHYDEPLVTPTAATDATAETEPTPTAWQVDYALAALTAAADTSAAAPLSGLTRQRQPSRGGSEPVAPPAEAPLAEVDAAGQPVRASRDYLHVEQVADFRLRYFDGAEWREDWDSQLDGLPSAVEAVLLFERPARKDDSLSAEGARALPEDAGVALPPGGYRMVIALSRGRAAPQEAAP